MLLERLRKDLDELKGSSRLRVLRPSGGVDFTSNDYLGFTDHPAVRRAVAQALEAGVPVGSGGSRLLGGNHPRFEELESFAAKFFQAESVLFFNSGFDANLALFSTLPTRHDAVVYDERVHASVKEGLRASFSKKYSARHNDVTDVEQAVGRARKNGARQVFVAVESLYSMDGDMAPLGQLAELARRLEVVLVVDEAHATAIYGATGRGLTEELTTRAGGHPPWMITLHTCGKALGACGALVAAPPEVKAVLINQARSFVYTTALSPLMAVAVQRGLELVDEEPWRRETLLALAQSGRQTLRDALTRWIVPPGSSQIIPVRIGDDPQTVSAARGLQQHGLDVRAVRPPTVPEGTSRLRISVNTRHGAEDMKRLAQALAELEGILGRGEAVAE